MIEEKERIKMSFGFAGDVVKQLIALSTAIVTLCVALTDKLFSSVAAQHCSGWLLAALVLFVISILCGLVTMMAITGTLGKPEEEETAGDETTTAHGDSEPQKKDLNKGTVYQSNITLFMYGQIVTFLFAIALSVVYLFVAVCSVNKETPKTVQPKVNAEKSIHVKRTSSFLVIDSMRVDTIKMDME